MKQVFIKRLAVTVFALCTLPSFVFAQNDKEKENSKEKKAHQQIVITRNGDKDEKTTIEIDGDKVKVNGKDVADLKDIQVHINSWNTPNVMALRGSGQNNFSMSFNDNGNTFFKVDSNRAMLGINTDTNDKGVAVESVVEGSAAEKAGLKKGDIITKIDSRKIEATDDVTDAVRAHKPGDKVAVTYLRDNKEYKATAALGRWKGMNVTGTSKIFDSKMWSEKENALRERDSELRERDRQLRERDNAIGNIFPRVQGLNGNTLFSTNNRPKLGMSVQDTDDGKGVKVLDVDDEGAAFKAGIKEDDILTQIDDKAVNSADEVATLVKEKKDQPAMKFQISRNGKAQTIEVKYPKKIKTVDL